MASFEVWNPAQMLAFLILFHFVKFHVEKFKALED